MNSIAEDIKNENENFEKYTPNEVTASAIEEGRRIAHDKDYPGYHSMEALRKALEV